MSYNAHTRVTLVQNGSMTAVCTNFYKQFQLSRMSERKLVALIEEPSI